MLAIPLLLEPCAWDEIAFLGSRQMLPGKPTPLIDYVQTERDWVNVRAEVLAGIRRAVSRLRSNALAGAREQKEPPQSPLPAWGVGRRKWLAGAVLASLLLAAAWFYYRDRHVPSAVPDKVVEGSAPAQSSDPGSAQLQRVLIPNGPSVRAIALSPSQDGFAISTDDASVQVRSLPSGAIRWKTQAKPIEGSNSSSPDQYETLLFSVDGSRLFGARRYGQRTAWVARDGSELWSGSFHSTFSGYLAASRDASVIASAGAQDYEQTSWAGGITRSSKVILIDAASGHLKLTLGDVKGAVWSLASSPDGRTVVVGTNELATKSDLLLAWDVQNGALRWRIPVPETILGLVFSNDGAMVASFGKPGRLWDPTKGRLIGVLDDSLDGKVASFSRDDRTLTAVGNPLVIWDARSYKRLKSVAFPVEFETAAISSNGSAVITGGADGSVRLWRVSD